LAIAAIRFATLLKQTNSGRRTGVVVSAAALYVIHAHTTNILSPSGVETHQSHVL